MGHRFISIPINGPKPGITLRAAVQGSGPLVLLVHGFPEGWYSWRHQLGPIAAAGLPLKVETLL